LEKARMELEAMEREKKMMNLRDNQRERRNQAGELGNQRLDRRR